MSGAQVIKMVKRELTHSRLEECAIKPGTTLINNCRFGDSLSGAGFVGWRWGSAAQGCRNRRAATHFTTNAAGQRQNEKGREVSEVHEGSSCNDKKRARDTERERERESVIALQKKG